MLFVRDLYTNLLAWKKQAKRKPLLIMGARQIGKTTLLKTFGQQEFANLAYFNLEENPALHEFFQKQKDPKAIVSQLSLLQGRNISPSDTLLVLDEIQECPQALTSLKYFQESMPELAVAGAGSLLGISLGKKQSFPVGKVEFLDLFPLTFAEYLLASNKKLHASYQHFLQSKEIAPIPIAFFQPLTDAFKEYLLVGGMPEAASDYLENRSLESTQKIQDHLLRAYQFDFVKHTSNIEAAKIHQVWNTLPSQLAKENKKFIYKVVKSGARAREYENAIQWLQEAGLIYKVPRLEKPSLPLKAYEDLTDFKLYAFETGLLMKLAELHPSIFLESNALFTEFKGSLAENFVAQSLRRKYGSSIYYWTSKGTAELDFIVDHKGQVIPIEVKSGQSTKAKSMAVYEKKYSPKIRVRISPLNLHLSNNFLNVPIFYAECIDQLIEKSLSN